MPVQRGTTTRNGERMGFYRWGSSGKRYFYQIGNEASRKRAKAKAKRQGRAIMASD